MYVRLRLGDCRYMHSKQMYQARDDERTKMDRGSKGLEARALASAKAVQRWPDPVAQRPRDPKERSCFGEPRSSSGVLEFQDV